MIELLKKNIYLIGVAHRRKWVFLIALALLVSVTEAIGALLLFSLLGVMAVPGGALDAPIMGLLDRLLPGQDRATLILAFGSLVAIFFVFRGALYLFQSYAQNRVGQAAGARLAATLMGGYLRMPYPFHLLRNSSELLRNLHGSTYEWVGGILIPSILVISECLLMIAIGLVLAAKAPLPTLLTIVIVTPIVLLINRAIQPRMMALGQENLEANKANIQSQQQSFRAVRDIKLLGKEQHFEAEFARSRINAARTYYLRSTFTDAPRIAIETLLVLFVVGVLALSVLRDQSLDEAMAVLGLFGYAVIRILPAFNRVLSSINNMRFGIPAVEILYADLRLVEDVGPEAEGVRETVPFLRDIRLRDVSFAYEGIGEPVLNDVTLFIEKGTSVGIVGPTGSGKSTLIDLILGLIDPSSGQVLVDGVDIRTDRRGWQRNLGVVSQNIALIDDTLRRNIALGLDEGSIDDAAIERAVDLAQLSSFVASLPDGLDTMVGESGVRLSGGQRQRVAIARALYRDPAVLVLDEGTSALDNKTEQALLDAIELARRGKTIIMVAHRMSTVQSCDRILTLEEGHITADIEPRSDDLDGVPRPK